MKNYNSISQKSNKKFNLLRNPLRAKAYKRFEQFEKPAQNNFSLPHTPLFYLFWHSLNATLAAARAQSSELQSLADAQKAAADALADAQKAAADALADAQKAAADALADAQKAAADALADAQKAGKLGDGIEFEQSGSYGVFKKGRYKIAVDLNFYISTICRLPKKELAIFPLALVFLLSQSRRIGKTWKKDSATFEITRKEFLEFAGVESGKLSARVVKAALLAINTTQILVGKQPAQSLYNSLQNTTPPTAKSKQYSAGFKITIDKGNKAFGILTRATHTMPNAAARELKLRDFLVYLELKSAFAAGFESTAVDNIIRAGDFGQGIRHAARTRGQIKATLQRIVQFEPTLKGLWADFANNQIRFEGAPADYYEETPTPSPAPSAAPSEPSPAPSEPQITPAIFVANVNVYLFGNAPPLFNYLSVSPVELEKPPSEPSAAPAQSTPSEPPRLPTIFDNMPDPTRLLPAPRKKIMRARTFDSLPFEIITDRPSANDETYDLNTKAGKSLLSAFLRDWRPLIEKVIGKLKNGVKIAPGLLYAILGAFCSELLSLLNKLTKGGK